jgi:hypothetical protein
MSIATAHKPIVHFRRAAAVRMVFFSFSAAAMMAEPPMTVEREPNEPTPACTYVVDPWKIRICSIGISSAAGGDLRTNGFQSLPNDRRADIEQPD